MDLSSKIEALIFVAGEPVAVNKLARICDEREEEIKKALTRLKEKLKDGGLRLIESSDSVELATAGETALIVEKFLKEDMKEELTPASLETLAVIACSGPISRARIDDIRGVDSRFILRALAVRGLVEKTENTDDLRVPRYDLTPELLKYLGVENKEKLKKLIEQKNE